MRWSLCICTIMPKLDLETRVIILMHKREILTTTNTARLAALALPNSEIRVRGVEGKAMSSDGLVVPGRTSLFLFPSETATELSHEFIADLRAKSPDPIQLIVPDGSWRQAFKVGKRIPALSETQWVKLPIDRPSEYQLRKEPNLGNLSTFEAIARALGFIEGPVQGSRIQSEMETVFKTMVDRTLWIRGKLRPDECLGGISDEAIADRNGTGNRALAGT